MEIIKWLLVGAILLALDIYGLLSNDELGMVKVYNFMQKQEEQYLGVVWIQKKRGKYYVKIPQKMLEASLTTEYKLKSVSAIHKVENGEKLQVLFADSYQTETLLSGQMTVKNYIATSGRL